jgi:hypothetical protein
LYAGALPTAYYSKPCQENWRIDRMPVIVTVIMTIK